ncbi:MAG: SulP family inorganic anion transporter [Chlamydiia bacterium]|nr:SulP family inorganic anion transporter [Chlamydiia bacterium]
MRDKIKSDLFAGFITALFSMPIGMAYAKVAGVNPIYGLFSGMWATSIAAMTSATPQMICTVTGAIAISTKSVLDLAGIQSDQMPEALFALTFLIGLIMLLMGLLKLGGIIDFVSNTVMTGFIVGIAYLIILGELGELVGIDLKSTSKLQLFVEWIQRFKEWDPLTAIVGLGSIVLMSGLRFFPKTRQLAPVVTIVFFTLLVQLGAWDSVIRVGDEVAQTSRLPSFSLPDYTLFPKLIVGAFSVALIALTQAAGVSSALPHTLNMKPSHSKDFIGQGLGNLVGSFFQSMGTGGSLSISGISLGAGAETRLAGISQGIFMALIVFFAGSLISYIPVASISGVLCVVAGLFIVVKIDDIKLITKTSKASFFVMCLTFLLALLIPLQWTIFLGAALSMLFFVWRSSQEIHLACWEKMKSGDFKKGKVPEKLGSKDLMILDYEGIGFFGEVPRIEHLMPSIENTKSAVIIWKMNDTEDVHSTFLKWLKEFVEQFQSQGNKFILEGVSAPLYKELEEAGLVRLIGSDYIFSTQEGILSSLNRAIQAGEAWIKSLAIDNQ